MKIIALLPTRNEEWIIESSLQNISRWADIIIVADQMSTDRTREICARFEKVVLIDNKNQDGHSNKVRWQLLEEARKYEGNNVLVCIDADEVLVPQTFLDKKYFESFLPGQRFEIPWIQLWKSENEYRTDGDWAKLIKPFAFIDDRKMKYNDEVVVNDHTDRIPFSLLTIVRLDSALLHLEYVPFEKSQMKQAWYRCSELIAGKRNARRINTTYSSTRDGTHVKTKRIPEEWKKNITIPSELSKIKKSWHKDQIMKWFDEFGINFFEPLDIWHIEELKSEFVRRTQRQPKPKYFPKWIIILNKIKNKLK